jgi:very-short-patch-repair endonuclease
MKKSVLVAVLKSPRDKRLLLRWHRYRIPLRFAPKRRFTHVAFYEPKTGFGERGKCIRYYAHVSKRAVKKRIELLPRESAHPRAGDDYLVCSFRKVKRLARPIRNIIPRRISFGFTDLRTLHFARDVLELYHVAPTEQLIARELEQLGIPYLPQHPLQCGKKRFRIDLAVPCKAGSVAIECDNRKAHAGKVQKHKDRRKDALLRRHGWRVLRLRERDIVERIEECLVCIKTAVRALGGTHTV